MKYGLFPENVGETDPWDSLCIDLIGPHVIRQANWRKLQLWCVTMIDPATTWFKMAWIDQKDVYMVADVVESTWFM